ncbi:type IV secretory system conjugative DNA transfer family protein [Amycolatopsis acidicola]|uniref:Type IV secretory system conjugative DNA transfer family protein n=1 Tax=Amycolatopsis acidicola TaxID=2596893 RepID=A0A5N0VH18_9PSEU|nr:TraM recognition domain-containing protein [Amycolatopsis acidicola]KAA9163962.1 type IV secretory system conjugative DNA transfer family protein [Amycolatopsis acidicola]
MPRQRTDRLGLDRDVALMALLCASLLTLFLVAVALVAAAVIATGTHGGAWAWPPFEHWLPAAAAIVRHADDPAAGLPEPWRTGLSGDTEAFWLVFGLQFFGAAGVISAVAVPAWRRLRPAEPGHASGRDLRRTLTPAAARKTARWTRGDLPPAQRRRAPLSDIAAPLHRGPNRQRLVTSLETPTGTIAPTRSGKSRTDLVHKVLAAPGALLASTTKDDLAEWGLLARTRRADAGPVWLIDATGTVEWPAKARWSPVTGCHDPAVALRRAETLIEASALGLEDIGGNDKVFRGRAAIVLQAYLLAAAMHQRKVTDLVAWAVTKPPDQEPVELLRPSHPELAHNLRSEIGMVAETSDAVWMSVRRAIEPFMNPAIRHFATPDPGDELDIDDFLTHQGSLFVIAGEHQAPQARPVLTALAEQILTTAQDTALKQPRRRMEPPITAILDELYAATPVPRLPALIADSAGRGVLIHWSAQSRSQLDELYGEPGRLQLIDNTLTLTVFPGLKDDKTLEWLSTLCGQHRRRTYQHHSDGILGPGRSAVGTETVPTYRPGDIRTLDRGRVLILHGNLLPILGRTVDVEKRDDWHQLRADVAAIRRGDVAITPDGFSQVRRQGGRDD